MDACRDLARDCAGLARDCADLARSHDDLAMLVRETRESLAATQAAYRQLARDRREREEADAAWRTVRNVAQLYIEEVLEIGVPWHVFRSLDRSDPLVRRVDIQCSADDIHPLDLASLGYDQVDDDWALCSEHGAREFLRRVPRQLGPSRDTVERMLVALRRRYRF